jgi:EpsI family protein
MPEIMPPTPSKKAFPSTTILMIAGVLAAQMALYAYYTKAEKVPVTRPLEQFPSQLGSWTKTQDGVVEQEVQDILKADDLLNRFYGDTKSGQSANLFVASFRSQRTGAAPHSPKNCLPGSGWTPIVSDRVMVKLNERPEPIEVNRYIVQRGEAKSLVIYWYQSRERAVAGEVEAKLFTMWDAIKDNRTDTALVRVVMGLPNDESTAEAMRKAEDFIRAFYGPLRQYLPV